MSIATKIPRTIIASGTTNAATASTRGAVDLRTSLGGIVTIKITNEATGPTVACTAKILIAHDSGNVPTTDAAGAVWKTIDDGIIRTGGTTDDAISEYYFSFGAEIMHLEIEFSGNTVQDVVVEAFLSEISSFT